MIRTVLLEVWKRKRLTRTKGICPTKKVMNALNRIEKSGAIGFRMNEQQCEVGPQADLKNFLAEIATLILPWPVRADEVSDTASTPQVAALNIFLDGKLIFGIPIPVRTDDELSSLTAAIESYNKTLM